MGQSISQVEMNLNVNIYQCNYVQSRKMYCIAFCTSPVALLAGLNYSASCNGLQWLDTAMDLNTVCEDVAWMTHLYLGKHVFSWHFTNLHTVKT